jgi:flagellar basal-body rod modification protein FlgD
MPVENVGHIGYTPPQQSAGAGLGALDSEMFLKLLVAQMRYQNPMEPMDATAMMQQTAQFTQVETLQQVASAQQQLLGMSQAAMAAGLVGKEVTALAMDGSHITGVVDAISFTPTGPMLSIGDQSVPMTAATEIRGTEPAVQS